MRRSLPLIKRFWKTATCTPFCYLYFAAFILLFLFSCDTLPEEDVSSAGVPDVLVNEPDSVTSDSLSGATEMETSTAPKGPAFAPDPEALASFYDNMVEDETGVWYRIDWDDLSNVTFETIYIEEEMIHHDVPTFSREIKSLHNQGVELQGFVVPLEPEIGLYALSANPKASCFFCGGSGPESVVGIEVSNTDDRMVIDAVLTFRGTLLLNVNDPFQLTYRMTNVVIVEG